MPPKKSPCRFRQLDFVLQGLFFLSGTAGLIQGGSMATTDIGMPSVRGVQNNLMSYGAGVVSGLAYNLVSGFTGSGLIGGAISAAVAGSIASPQLGQMIGFTFLVYGRSMTLLTPGPCLLHSLYFSC